MATHSSILPWRIPWTERPGRLHSVGPQESDMTETTEHSHWNVSPTRAGALFFCSRADAQQIQVCRLLGFHHPPSITRPTSCPSTTSSASHPYSMSGKKAGSGGGAQRNLWACFLTSLPSFWSCLVYCLRAIYYQLAIPPPPFM